MKLFFYTLLLLGFTFSVSANSGRKGRKSKKPSTAKVKKDKTHGIDDHDLKIKVKKAEKLLVDHSYYNAATILKEVADSLPENEYVNYLTGSIYFKARDYKNAEVYLGRVAKTQEKMADYPLSLFQYAETLQMNQKYNEAKLYFLKFSRLKNRDYDTKLHKKYSRRLAGSCTWAMAEIQKDSAFVGIDSLLGDINHGYTDFSPLPLAEDELVFASLRYDTVISFEKEEEKFFPVKLYKSYYEEDENGWSKPQEIRQVNHVYEHTANGALTPDGNQMYMSRCFQDAHNKVVCNIYRSEKTGSLWSKPEKIHGKVNLHGYTSTQPTIGVAYKRKRRTKIKITVLYFSSDRPGGKGGLDLWYAIMDEKGNFGAPLNCKRVNTYRDEVSPFYDQDSSMLYFSSNYHVGFGGHDVFKVKGNTKRWSKAENLMLPVNSSYDDTYYVIDKNNRKIHDKGYLVSNRPGGKVLTSETCCDDIYRFDWFEPEYNELTGQVYSELVVLVEDTSTAMASLDTAMVVNVDSLQLKKEVTKSELSNTRIGLVRKRHVEEPSSNDYTAFSQFIEWVDTTDAAGIFNSKVQSSKDYVLVLENDEFGTKLIPLEKGQKTVEVGFEKTDSTVVIKKREEIAALSLDIAKEDLVKDKKFVLENVYFDSGKDEFLKESEPSLFVLLTFLEDNPKVKIEISGHTDNDGDADYNQKLSERRAKNVLKYLTANGVKENRLQSVGYGESQPLAPNTSNAGKKKNRRTEVKIL